MMANARTYIQANFRELESRIDFDVIKPLLLKRELLDSAKIQGISSKELTLFDEVRKMEFHEFSNFIEILRDSGYVIVADWLNAEEERYKLRYKMDTNPLGRCIIINNVNFTAENTELFQERKHSEQDADDLAEMFGKIGYEVSQHRNLSAEQMKDELFKFSQLDYSMVDSSIVCIMTHGINFGESDYLIGSDGNLIEKKLIYDIFSYKNCEGLRKKPKIFFFHACRLKNQSPHILNGMLINLEDNKPAEYFLNGAIVQIAGKSFKQNSDLNSTDTLGFEEVKQPDLSDVIVIHSSCPGERSVGYFNEPSLFCRQLVKVFSENYKKCDLDTLINMVTDGNMSVHYEKFSPYGLVHF